MKAKRILSASLILILSLCLSVNAVASAWEDFTDVSGHWAQTALQNGYNDGLITGYDATTLAPDAPITTAQMITVLCRVLNASETADITALGISADVWYAEAAGKALKLGLISANTGNLDAPMSRQNALAMMAKAFCLVPAEPNYTVLDSFSDAGGISAENKGALSALVSAKLVIGFAGALNVNSSISRAEFLTVLYRVAENYMLPAALNSAVKGGSVLKGSGSLNYISCENIWFDCSSANIALNGVTAESVTLRSHALASLDINSGSQISRLVVAVGTGRADFGSLGNAKIGQLCLESCSGAEVGSDVGSVELTGSGISLNLSGSHDYLIIAGNGNVVTLAQGASLTRLIITGANNTVLILPDGNIGAVGITGSNNSFTLSAQNELREAEISGSENHVTINGTADSISLAGQNTVLDGTGSVKSLLVNAFGCKITLAAANTNDLSGAAERERVAKLVTLGYAGNYTLKWAQEHDYTSAEKEIWINSKGYASNTDYLIWINLSMQRVNVFKVDSGRWALCYSCIVGTGAPGRGTPVGIWKTTYKSMAGWTTSTYTVKPVVGFKDNTGYAFHSRLYYPGTSKLSDSSIGFPVSHGCVRMYEQDINYIYNNIPIGTTVVVY